MELAELHDVEVVAEGLAFPEAPVALDDGSVLVVEVGAGRLVRCRSGGEVEVVAELGGGPNGAAIGPDGGVYVCNNGGVGRAGLPGTIQRVDLESGQFETIYTECEGQPLVAPNDLVFDASGSFWFTDLKAGTICYAAADGTSITASISSAQSPNGIGLSPDGSVLYWAETSRRQVHRRRLDGPGQVVASPGYDIGAVIRSDGGDPWSLLAGLPGAHELDSLAVDSAGAVCVGTLCDSGITEIAEDGSSVVLHRLPAALADRAVTNICFGGPDRGTAYVTCGEHGRLVACPWVRPGLPLAFHR